MTGRARALLLLACLFVLSLIGFFAAELLGSAERPEVLVPATAGMPEADGLRLLRAAGLEPETHPEYHAELPPGSILRTAPPEGGRVRAGRKIRVDVVSAAPLLEVPNLVGRDIEEAEGTLRRLGSNQGVTLGLVPIVREAPAESGTLGGTILLQEPPAGSLLPAGSRIDLVVAAAPEDTRVVVPNLQGRLYDEAESALVGAGLAVGQVRSLSVAAPSGTIYATDPPMGRRVPRGTHIDLTIAGTIPAPPPAARRIDLSYTVPDSAPNGNYQIFLRDGSGDREIWHGKAKPGAVVATEVEVRGAGAPAFRVLCGGKEIDAWEL